ncbi:hypothetical protein HSE3_gp127 [Bacillus phage vB_BceM-HSE3]|nr:hypothetical protein HSE3_gp127 [Bacillus phage vB_BceM-HSE3]
MSLIKRLKSTPFAKRLKLARLALKSDRTDFLDEVIENNDSADYLTMKLFNSTTVIANTSIKDLNISDHERVLFTNCTLDSSVIQYCDLNLYLSTFERCKLKGVDVEGHDVRMYNNMISPDKDSLTYSEEVFSDEILRKN